VAKTKKDYHAAGWLDAKANKPRARVLWAKASWMDRAYTRGYDEGLLEAASETEAQCIDIAHPPADMHATVVLKDIQCATGVPISTVNALRSHVRHLLAQASACRGTPREARLRRKVDRLIDRHAPF